MTDTQSSPVVIVGPTHPYKGGIAQHTTRLALELEQRHPAVIVESWSHQYPKALYPRDQRVPGSNPEVGIPSAVNEKLAWFNPLSWWSAGRRHRHAERAVLNIPTPLHAIPYLVILWAMGPIPVRQAVVHNVEPHESGLLDRPLMSVLLRRFDVVIVHNSAAQEAAHRLGVASEALYIRSLPSPWPEKHPVKKKQKRGNQTRFLFFGTIRPYKGLDVLLHALRDVPSASLLIAGEFWNDESSIQQMIKDLALEDRVTVQAGYVPESELDTVFSGSDVLVLPYHSGTGSIVRELGFSFGLPVIATSVGSIGEGIDHDQNGLIVEPGDTASLCAALRTACEPAALNRWRRGVATRQSPASEQWEEYCSTVLTSKKLIRSDSHG